MKLRATLVDHVVLTVSDVDTSARWWARVTGTTPARLPDGDVAFDVGAKAIRLRAGVPPPPGSVTVCLVVDASIHDIFRLAEDLCVAHGEVCARTGAAGPLQAVPLDAPDGYRVEVATAAPEESARHTGVTS